MLNNDLSFILISLNLLSFLNFSLFLERIIIPEINTVNASMKATKTEPAFEISSAFSFPIILIETAKANKSNEIEFIICAKSPNTDLDDVDLKPFLKLNETEDANLVPFC